MANIDSQKKRILRAERERLENRRYTSTIKTYFRRLEAAAAAGIFCTIGLLSGGWTEDDLREAGCIEVYRDAADLLARFAESPIMATEISPEGSGSRSII